MPSWCSNDILIIGEKKSIDAIEKTGFDFQKIRPLPKKIEQATDESWYHWCLDNWGSKWNAKKVDMGRKDTCTLHVVFETPWNPPGHLFRYLCDKYSVDVVGSYYVEGWPMKAKWINYEMTPSVNESQSVLHIKSVLHKIMHRRHKYKGLCPNCHSDKFGFHKVKNTNPKLSDDVVEQWVCKNCDYRPFADGLEDLK